MEAGRLQNHRNRLALAAESAPDQRVNAGVRRGPHEFLIGRAERFQIRYERPAVHTHQRSLGPGFARSPAQTARNRMSSVGGTEKRRIVGDEIAHRVAQQDKHRLNRSGLGPDPPSTCARARAHTSPSRQLPYVLLLCWC